MDKCWRGMLRSVLLPSNYAGEVCVPSSRAEIYAFVILAALSPLGAEIFQSGLFSSDLISLLCALKRIGYKVETETLPTGNGYIRVFGQHRNSGAIVYVDSEEVFLSLVLLSVTAGFCLRIRLGRNVSARFSSSLAQFLKSHGISLSASGKDVFVVSGILKNGIYKLNSNAHPLFILLLTLILSYIDGESNISLLGSDKHAKLAFSMPLAFLSRIGKDAVLVSSNAIKVFGSSSAFISGVFVPDGDYSLASPLMCIAALSKFGLKISGFHPTVSVEQAERSIFQILSFCGANINNNSGEFFIHRGLSCASMEIDALDAPGSVMSLIALSAFLNGKSVFKNISSIIRADKLSRFLRLFKLSGIKISYELGNIYVDGTAFESTVLPDFFIDCECDPEIAMVSAILSAGGKCQAVIDGAECLMRIYPLFFRSLINNGGRMRFTYDDSYMFHLKSGLS